MVARVVMACLVLHNLLRMRYSTGQQDDFGGEVKAPIVLEPTGFSQNPEEYSEGLFHG